MSTAQPLNLSASLAPLAARLIRAASPGVLLAACASTPINGGQGGAGGAFTDSGTGGSSGFPDLPEPPTGGALPDGGGAYPRCYGEGSPMLSGPCCLSVRCIEPSDGGTECKSPSAVTAQELGYSNFGSGTCLCNVPGLPGASVSGPFSPESAQPHSRTQGRCCYRVATQWCTGRPLLVDGSGLVAALVFGDGWV